MKIMRFIIRPIETMSEWSGKGLSFLLPVLAGALTYEVIARYVFNAPTLWSYDMGMFLYGGIGILAGAHALHHKVHVNFDIVYARLSLRTRAIVDVITALLFFFFCFLVIWQGAKMALWSLAVRETTITSWSPPLYPFKMLIPIGGFMLLLQGIAQFMRNLYFAIHGKEL